MSWVPKDKLDFIRDQQNCLGKIMALGLNLQSPGQEIDGFLPPPRCRQLAESLWELVLCDTQPQNQQELEPLAMDSRTQDCGTVTTKSLERLQESGF